MSTSPEVKQAALHFSVAMVTQGSFDTVLLIVVLHVLNSREELLPVDNTNANQLF